MDLTIYADKPEYKKNDTINYTITINADKEISEATLDIIPSTGIFPDAFIVPDTGNVTSSDSNTLISTYVKDGIYSLAIDSPAQNELKLYIPAYVGEHIRRSNTVSVIADITYSDNSRDNAYSQLTLSENTPLILIIMLFIASIMVSSVIIYLLKKLYFSD